MSNFSYIFKRLLYVIPVLLGVCLLILILFSLGPDPALITLGKHATAEQIQELRHEWGLHLPYWHQYLNLVKTAFTFDFGYSIKTHQKISEMLRLGAIPSLTVSVPAFVLSFIVSISISLFVAFFRGKWQDKSVVFVCVLLMSISSLAYILFAQYYFAFKLGWFEISGYEEGFPHFIPYVALPVVIWLVLGVGRDVRFYRTVILDEVYQDYVRTARAKGLSEVKIMFKHVLKNAMVPILTYVVIQLPFLILGALLLESFFSIPGLGGLTMNAINTTDFPVIRAIVILSAILTILFNTLTDFLYTVVDPRVRLK